MPFWLPLVKKLEILEYGDFPSLPQQIPLQKFSKDGWRGFSFVVMIGTSRKSMFKEKSLEDPHLVPESLHLPNIYFLYPGIFSLQSLAFEFRRWMSG